MASGNGNFCLVVPYAYSPVIYLQKRKCILKGVAHDADTICIRLRECEIMKWQVTTADVGHEPTAPRISLPKAQTHTTNEWSGIPSSYRLSTDTFISQQVT